MTFSFQYEMQLIGLRSHAVEHNVRDFKRNNFQWVKFPLQFDPNEI